MFTQERTIVGVDQGYGYVKATDGLTMSIFPSAAGTALQANFDNELLTSGKGHILTVKDRDWFYGHRAQRHSRHPLAMFARERTEQQDLMRVLFYAAIAELEVKGRIAICQGLPIEWYSDKPQLERLFLGEHRFAVDDVQRTVVVDHVAVLPQPFGSFFARILDSNGQVIDAHYAQSKVGILDVGTYTTDYALCDNLEYVARASGSETVAMSDVWRQIRDGIQKRYGIEYDLHQIDRLLWNGRSATIRGRAHDLTPLLQPAVDVLADQVLAGARQLWGNATDFSQVLLTGGGARWVEDRVRAVYPHCEVMPEAQTGNVRGFHRYAVRKFGR